MLSAIPLQAASLDIWDKKYRLLDKDGLPVDIDIDATHDRVARALAEVEKPAQREHFYKEFLDAMYCGAIPAGRIMSNAGAQYHKPAVSLINCTVSSAIPDSMDGIFSSLHEAALTLKAGCGIGYEFSTLRPSGAFVAGAGATTNGPLAFMDVFDKMCFTVSSAGGRRGAQMGTFDVTHPDVEQFINAKRENGRLRQFNLSLLITDAFMKAVQTDSEWQYEWDGVRVGNPVRAKWLWDTIMQSNYNFAEPGFLLVDRINRYNNLWFCEHLRATNPCVTGDTKIAVAGRGPVEIKQLVKEGKDVPVYCHDFKTGETVVRMGRNPRRTGKNHKVFRITLDDGSSFKANAVHNIYLRDGTKVQVKDLKIGASLIPFKIKADKTGNSWVRHLSSGSYVRDYWLMLNCKYDTEFDFGTGTGKIHGHHVDGNHFNNEMDNLEALTHEDHNSHHLTDANPTQTGWTTASAKEKRQYRQRMSESQSNANNGMFGRTHTKKTKKLIGTSTVERFTNAKFVRKHSKAVAKAMTDEVRAKISESHTQERQTVVKTCKECNVQFELQVIRGNKSCRKFCTQACAARSNSKVSASTPKSQETLDRISAGSKKFANSKLGRVAKSGAGSASIVQRALKCGSMLLHLGHKINARTWDSLKSVLHESGIKPTIGAAWIDNQWDGDWSQFRKECKEYNHKVVSIVACGEEDVFNITVDEHHNYFIITNERKLRKSTILTGVLSKNCGEQPLPPYGSCLLGSINLTKFVDNPFGVNAKFNWGKFNRIVSTFTRMLDNVVELNGLPLEQQRHEITWKRRHGMGFFGLGSAMAMLGISYGDAASLKFTEDVSKTMAITGFLVGSELSEEKGEAPVLQKQYSSSELLQFSKYNTNYVASKSNSRISGRELFLKSHYFDIFSSAPEGQEVLKLMKRHGSRFTHHSSIAPTGTLSLSFGGNVSNGIEPSFSHSYNRNIIREGRNAKESVEVCSYEYLAYRELVNKNVRPQMYRAGQVDDGNYLPSCFADTDSLTPKHHIDIQASAQKWVDSSISKTINVPTDITVDAFKDIYVYAFEQGLKGCTTFRFNPENFQGVLVKTEDLKATTYRFTLEDGTHVDLSGDKMVEYGGQTQTAANLFDAIKENYFGKF